MDGLGYTCDFDGLEIAGETHEIPIPPSAGAPSHNEVMYACTAHVEELEAMAARWWAHWALHQLHVTSSCN